MSKNIEVTAAVAAALSEWGARMELLPKINISELRTLTVLVSPGGSTTRFAGRNSIENEIEVDVAWFKKATVADVPGLLDIVESAVALLLGKRLAGYTSAICVGVDNYEAFDRNALEREKRFSCVRTFSFRVD